MFKSKAILFFIFFSLPFIYKLQVQGNLFGDYVPPAGEKTQEVYQKRSVGTGSRSDCQSDIAKNSVSLIVPQQNIVHLTSATQPSLFIISDSLPSKENFHFSLVDTENLTTLVEKNITVSEGITKIELPKSRQLKSGKVYIWSVGIPCADNPEDYREVLSAAIKRTKLSPRVKAQLNQTKDNLEHAKIYAENGLWYEALETAVEEQNKDSQVTYPSYLNRLLSSVDLH